MGEDGPGRGHLCHTDTLLPVVFILVSKWLPSGTQILTNKTESYMEPDLINIILE